MLFLIVIAFVKVILSYIYVILQDAVFSSVAKNIVEFCMNGYNGTIFA